jgi:hypothetical protein
MADIARLEINGVKVENQLRMKGALTVRCKSRISSERAKTEKVERLEKEQVVLIKQVPPPGQADVDLPCKIKKEAEVAVPLSFICDLALDGESER